MPEYSSRNISGDAAEYLVAYTVTRQLRWPCRLFGVDIGVDGEMEVLDAQGRSSGDLIKIQVKAVERMKPGKTHVYVTEDHIRYWKNFSAPIIICCVDHATAKVYWQSIYQTAAYLSSGTRRRITFTPSHPVLNTTSKDALRELVTPRAAKEFSSEIALLRDYVNKWAPMSGIVIGPNGGACLDQVDDEAAEVSRSVARLREGRRNFPWRFSPLDCQVIDAAENMTKLVRRFIDQAAAESFY